MPRSLPLFANPGGVPKAALRKAGPDCSALKQRSLLAAPGMDTRSGFGPASTTGGEKGSFGPPGSIPLIAPGKVAPESGWMVLEGGHPPPDRALVSGGRKERETLNQS